MGHRGALASKARGRVLHAGADGSRCDGLRATRAKLRALPAGNDVRCAQGGSHRRAARPTCAKSTAAQENDVVGAAQKRLRAARKAAEQRAMGRTTDISRESERALADQVARDASGRRAWLYALPAARHASRVRGGRGARGEEPAMDAARARDAGAAADTGQKAACANRA